MINLGGGVTTDMGGFVAATYMRGIDFCNISTTVEGMVDASVGSKTGVNLGHVKNIVGAFAEPRHIWMDTKTLETLEDRAYIQGFGEIVKHGLIADPEYYRLSVKCHAKSHTPEELEYLIRGSVQIKTDIVTRDPREAGERKLLNFGHTIGHAIESLSLDTEFPLFHGEAVAIGMVYETRISALLGMISEETSEKICQSIAAAGLPTTLPDVSIDSIMDLIQHDKKAEKKHVKWTLLRGIGAGVWDCEVPEEIVRKALLCESKTPFLKGDVT